MILMPKKKFLRYSQNILFSYSKHFLSRHKIFFSCSKKKNLAARKKKVVSLLYQEKILGIRNRFLLREKNLLHSNIKKKILGTRNRFCEERVLKFSTRLTPTSFAIKIPTGFPKSCVL